MPSNRGNPTAFSAHAKRRNNAGSKGHFHGNPGSKGGRKANALLAISLATMQGSVQIEGTHHMMMITIISGAIPTTTIEGMTSTMEKKKSNAGHQGNGRPSKKARYSRYEKSNVVNNKQKEYYLISTLSTTSPSNTLGNWLIDSGASRHFTGYKEALSNLIEKETNLEIILGDSATYLVKGVGNVTLQLNQGNTIHLQEVLYVLDLKKNMVSFLAMEDKGYKVAFIDGKVCVWKRNFKDAFTLGFRVCTLYQVAGSPLGAMSCDTSLQSELWHRRFAHLHYKALPI